jgi:hypothetical protein
LRKVGAFAIVLGKQREHGIRETVGASPGLPLTSLDGREELSLERVQQSEYEPVVSHRVRLRLARRARPDAFVCTERSIDVMIPSSTRSLCHAPNFVRWP